MTIENGIQKIKYELHMVEITNMKQICRIHYIFNQNEINIVNK